MNDPMSSAVPITNLVALVNVQTAVLCTLLATHPEPEKLLQLLDATIEMQFASADPYPDVSGYQTSWRQLFVTQLRKRVDGQRGGQLPRA